jgi:hypothetical protein
VPITNGIPGTAIQPQGIWLLTGVACLPNPSDTCYVTGLSTVRSAGAVLPIVDGVPGKATAVRQSTRLLGITCPAAATCYAVGIHRPDIGVEVTLVNGAVTSVSRIDAADDFFGISCTSATLCYAIGGLDADRTGVVVTLANGTPGAAYSPKLELWGIACVWGGNCVITGTERSPGRGGFALLTSGVPGPRVQVNGSQWLLGIACPSATSCVAGGERARDTEAVVVDLSI